MIPPQSGERAMIMRKKRREKEGGRERRAEEKKRTEKEGESERRGERKKRRTAHVAAANLFFVYNFFQQQVH
jgi:hypothetical protein